MPCGPGNGPEVSVRGSAERGSRPSCRRGERREGTPGLSGRWGGAPVGRERRCHQSAEGPVGGEHALVAVAVHAGWGQEGRQAFEQLEGGEPDRRPAK